MQLPDHWNGQNQNGNIGGDVYCSVRDCDVDDVKGALAGSHDFPGLANGAALKDDEEGVDDGVDGHYCDDAINGASKYAIDAKEVQEHDQD